VLQVVLAAEYKLNENCDVKLRFFCNKIVVFSSRPEVTDPYMTKYRLFTVPE
jgi:hypothetical protein